MIPLRRHPRFDLLHRFTNDELDGAERAIVSAHLRSCARCRDMLAFSLQVREAARKLRHPSPPEGLLEEILERRAAGERVILPMETPPVPRTTVSVGGAALAIGLVALGALGFLLLGSGEAAAGASSLSVRPAHPVQGQQIEVEFRSASALAAEPELRLRGRYRMAEEDPPRGALGSPFTARIRAAGGGVFRGSVWLPASAVYALFSVEDLRGERLEHNGHRLWEVLVYDEVGRPLFPALRQRFQVLQARRRIREALETARLMTELYPDRPEGWLDRLAYERRVGEVSSEDGLAAYRAQLARLEQIVARAPDPGGSAVAALSDLARLLGEEETARQWARRLEEHYPQHPLAQRNRILEILAAARSHPRGPAGSLRAFETEWDRAGPLHPSLVRSGFQAALAAGDRAAILRWAERYERQRPEEADLVAARLARLPELRPEGMERLRGVLDRLRPGVSRPLDRSAAEERARLEAARQQVLFELGRALLASGSVRAAVDTLKLAAGEAWNPELFRAVSNALLRAGEAEGAARYAAYAAADPLAEAGEGAELRAALGPRLGAGRWEALLEEGRRAMRGRLHRELTLRSPTGEARVVDPAGRERRLPEILRGRVGVLGFWWRLSDPSERDLGDFRRAAATLRRLGVELRIVTAAPPPGSEPAPRSGVGDLAVLHDLRGEAAAAYDGWRSPWYVVVDPEGRIRYETPDAGDAARHAAVLSSEPAGSRG